jgi:hypothetical protein
MSLVGSNLKIKPDYGNPSIVAPIYNMLIEELKKHLVALRTPMNPHNPPSYRPTDKVVPKDSPQYVSNLPVSDYREWHIHFVHYALADVANARSLGPNWSAHDYDIIAMLARALADGTLPLNAITCPNEKIPAYGVWTWERAYTMVAIMVNMEQEEARLEALYGEDSDELVDVLNDNIALCRQLGVGPDLQNPIFI